MRGTGKVIASTRGDNTLTNTVHLNGQFISETDAKVSVRDGGWLHGAGLFETMRAENGRVFRLDAHIERLRRSAAKLLTTIEPGMLPSAKVFSELLQRNELKTARVRLTVTAGSMQINPDADAPQLTVCATAAKLFPYPLDLYEKGAHVVICNFRTSPSDPVAGHKTTGYLPRLLGLREAQRVHCAEALWFTTANRLAEGSISNVFVVRKDVLKTPPLDTPVLPGITRDEVLRIAEEVGIETQQVPLRVDDLLDADEILLTNTMMQVMPVIRVEKHDIARGRVGPVAGKLLEEYRKRIKKECNDE
jgi:branched-chain amino acid aminotransferase